MELSDKNFKAAIIKMLNQQQKIMFKWKCRMSQQRNRSYFKNTQMGVIKWKNTIIEITYLLDGINSTVEMTDDRIGEPEHKSILIWTVETK